MLENVVKHSEFGYTKAIIIMMMRAISRPGANCSAHWYRLMLLSRPHSAPYQLASLARAPVIPILSPSILIPILSPSILPRKSIGCLKSAYT